MRAYTVKVNDKVPSDPIYDEAELRRAIASPLRKMKDPFTLHPWGKPEGPPRKRAVAVDRAFKIVTHASTGLVLAVLNKADKGVLVRVVDVMVPASVTNGNEKVDAWFAWINRTYSPGVLNLGVTVNKTIGLTSTLSQHHDWTEETVANAKADGFSTQGVSDGGNAGDVGHAGGRAVLDKIWVASLDRVEDFDFQNLIHWPLSSSYPLIWNPEGGIHRYDVPPGGDNHATHIHGDFIHSRPWGGSVARN